MKKLSILTASFFLSLMSYAQTTTNFVLEKKGTVNATQAMSKEVSMKLQNLEAPSPDGNSTKSMLLRKKALIEAKYPRTAARSSNRGIESNDTLAIGTSFLSNIGSAGNPSDNSMAISNDGIVVSAYNSAIFVRDTENDSTIGEIALNQFSAQIGMNFDNFDPKMIYDPENDRFMLIYLAGRTESNSFIVVCFSETKDPMGNWNVYSLPGNPLNDTSWSDYPAISMTKDEAFITINLLNPGGSWQTSFKQTVIWQIDKYDGYTGNSTLDLTLWSGIKEGGMPLRNMHPVRGGYDLKSKDQYFLSNRNFASMSDSVYLIHIDDTKASGAASIDVKLIRADKNYFLAPNARQSQGRFFATNDSRVLGGIYENNQIQYVHHGLDTITGNCVIYHGVISNLDGVPALKTRTIGSPTMDYGYPNIVYGGLIPGENKSIIGFNHTGVATNAGMSATYFDGNNYSETKIVKDGESNVRTFRDFLMRWGDYFGIQRKYNEDCKVWMSGYFGQGQDNKTWVSEVILPGDCYDTVVPQPYVENTLFPNPSVFESQFHFTLEESQPITVDLTDVNGKVVRVLYQDMAKKGENRIIINTQNLSIGVYFIRVYSENKSILTKKLVRQ